MNCYSPYPVSIFPSVSDLVATASSGSDLSHPICVRAPDLYKRGNHIALATHWVCRVTYDSTGLEYCPAYYNTFNLYLHVMNLVHGVVLAPGYTYCGRS